MVATPIGNLADLSLRAVHLLGRVDAVACEDTRVSGGLLQRLGLHKPLLSLHEHNEEAQSGAVIERLTRGECVAYVSDAGTPAVSDPGARLVAAVRAAGFRVVPVPGASSVVTALSAAGDVAGSGFRFVGFLPPKAQAREQALRRLAEETASVVLFEAPHRIEALADALAAVLPGRTLTLCRELTKQFESIHTLDTSAAPAWLAADEHHRRGEFVLVLHGRPAREVADEADAGSAGLDAWLQALIDELPLKQAVALAVKATGQPRNTVYARALALKSAGEAAGDESDADEAPAPAPVALPPLRRR